MKRIPPILLAVLDALPESVCLFCPKSKQLKPNRRWRETVGDVSELEDLSRVGLTPDLVRESCKKAIDKKGERVALALDKEGTRRLEITPVEGEKQLYLIVLRDHAELRRVEELRRDFIANVSHELRTPLTAVRGYVETLLDPKFLTMERVKEFLPIIFEHTERLHNLMLDLLSLSRLENPNTKITVSPLCLADELQEAVEATAPLARLKNISIKLRSPRSSLKVLANTEHLQRILVNLLDNAIKYSPPGGVVSLWTEIHGDFVWTHVKDRGQGIPPEELPRVFERFYRTKGALGGRERGSGLGLAIVKHIVQQLGGEITAASIVGQGSDFSFSLRLAQAHDGPQEIAPRSVTELVAPPSPQS